MVLCYAAYIMLVILCQVAFPLALSIGPLTRDMRARATYDKDHCCTDVDIASAAAE
jgi:hypothetical protein